MLSASPAPGSAALVALLFLGAAVWAGGLVTTVVVARVAGRTLPTAVRIEFFRAFGRAQGIVGPTSLAVALAAGAALLRGRSWDGLLASAVVVAATLVGTTGVGMAQARRMTLRRRAALDAPDDAALALQIRRGGRQAAALRIGIAGLTLALIVLGAMLVT